MFEFRRAPVLFWEAVGHWGPPGYTYAQMGPFPKNSSKMSELFEPLEPETKSLVFPHASQNISMSSPLQNAKRPYEDILVIIWMVHL